MPYHIPEAEPFYFPGNPMGCLLIRGSTGTLFPLNFIQFLFNPAPTIQKDSSWLIQSHGNRVISVHSMNEFYARIGSAEKEMLWLDQSGHLVLEDYSKEIAFDHILQFIESHID